MERALVVLETTDTGRELLAEAAQLADGTGARLDVLSLITGDEYDEQQDVLDAAGREEHTTYDSGAVLDHVKQDATEVVEEVLADIDAAPNWQPVAARVGDHESEADRILDVTERNKTDHLFVPGKRRSPTGKVVFGDRAQSLLLNFDGPVTTLLSE